MHPQNALNEIKKVVAAEVEKKTASADWLYAESDAEKKVKGLESKVSDLKRELSNLDGRIQKNSDDIESASVKV